MVIIKQIVLKLILLFRDQAVTDLDFNPGSVLPSYQLYFLACKEPLEPSVFLSVKWGVIVIPPHSVITQNE